MSKEEIKQKLAETKAELANVKGTECEVFSRVCGYLRPVQNWNKGKKEEFYARKTFNVSSAKCDC